MGAAQLTTRADTVRGVVLDHAARRHGLGGVVLARRARGTDDVARPEERDQLAVAVLEQPDRADHAFDDLDVLVLLLALPEQSTAARHDNAGCGFAPRCVLGRKPQSAKQRRSLETLEHFDDPIAIVNKCLMHVIEALIVSTPYTPEYSGKRFVVGEHRYCFNEKTFENYNCRIVRIAEHGKEQKEVVIIYEIRP